MPMSMSVSEAVVARKSIRAFLDTPVPDELLKEVLTKAARAPSGGNVQPWRIYVLNDNDLETSKLQPMLKCVLIVCDEYS